MAAKHHEHRYSPFRQTFGPHGRQDVHYHPCIEADGCNVVLMAETRECAGQRTGTHYRAALTVNGPRRLP